MKGNINMNTIKCPRCGKELIDNESSMYSAIECDNCHYQIDLYGTNHIQF